ncbi:MAG: hypothetical protein K0U86_02870 [Planctomycetes bacterium]|nr:hypothetical protein [Planctomycetota bacterium]MCH9723833.1 hypothetical protein [Planctomycetota bacterium]MCH9776262.1 hypothetical protein [Planctomycetota bacterium]
MRNLFFQQRIALTAFVFLSAIIFGAYYLFSITLSNTSFACGVTLLIFIFILSSYQLRKKLPFLSIGNTSTWLHFHIFVGLLSSVLFLLHIKMRIPDGLFEFILFLTYSTVFLSGVIGWILSRSVPYRLLSRGEEVIFERIPIHRRTIHNKVKVLIFDKPNPDLGSAIPDFYHKHLQSFFSGPCNQMRHLLHSKRHRHQLSQRFSALMPYLNEQEQTVLHQLEEQVQLKDDLDYQYALQATMKLWLFVHIPLTYSLIIFALFHTIAVCAFAGTIG